MPLIIITGFPSSGKTQRANEIKDFLTSRLEQEKKSFRIHVINDESLHIPKDAYNAIGTAHCVVHTGVPISLAKEWNANRTDGYDEMIFDELVSRYEEPEERNRWDSPLFTLIHDDVEIPADRIWDAVILKKPPPPNKSTVSKPVSATNYVYELDKATLEIINAFVESQREFGPGGNPMVVPRSQTKVINPSRTITSSELRRLRKQFVTYNKMNTTLDVDRLGDVFVEYLNSNLE
ncbi:chromatin associated protein KTI12-domain-containing protein [Mucor mucedo]|uniref:chromatin associated protein KTI12-domain-containing protein n=1 Tax=Mucor mucedo TaxID=29922 RepID=UPI00221EE9C6|nr:chromatin associated protein KTI12-domain-containing protein [Mucor mucedo]KAI7891068.1 chromatin associated protein KTI12-domain-containing protein [Mucor mucedo]